MLELGFCDPRSCHHISIGLVSLLWGHICHMNNEADLASLVMGFSMLALAWFHCTAVHYTPIVLEPGIASGVQYTGVGLALSL